MNATEFTSMAAARSSKTPRRSVIRQQWGVLFAVLVFLVTTLLCWGQLDALVCPLPPQQSVPESASTVRTSETMPQSFHESDFNRGWRKARQGWVQIQNYRVAPPVPQNFVQRISPLFWAVCLWMFAILVLVFAS